jgi:hypothetical protein
MPPVIYLWLAWEQNSEFRQTKGKDPWPDPFTFPIDPEMSKRLQQRMVDGLLIDAPTLIVDGGRIVGHDGRNRSLQAMALGIPRVPVNIKVLL